MEGTQTVYRLMKTLDIVLMEPRVAGVEEWQVWTPDDNGTCIGHGATRIDALKDAREHLLNTAQQIADVLSFPKND